MIYSRLGEVGAPILGRPSAGRLVLVVSSKRLPSSLVGRSAFRESVLELNRSRGGDGRGLQWCANRHGARGRVFGSGDGGGGGGGHYGVEFISSARPVGQFPRHLLSCVALCPLAGSSRFTLVGKTTSKLGWGIGLEGCDGSRERPAVRNAGDTGLITRLARLP